ncbi:MAG: hypothetical protein ISR68_03480 [Campylobacterales bacterium]|nr:hypothetical protein [Campylobacterales bacterium]
MKLLSLQIILLTVLFNGCATQSAFNVFKTDTYSNAFNKVFDSRKIYQDTLQYTKKDDILNNKQEVEAILNVTYLNPTSNAWDNADVHSFIVGLFIVNDNESSSNNFINNPNYELSINNVVPSDIKLVDSNMNIRGSIPLENKWAKYYLIKIKQNEIDIKDNKLTIKFSDRINKDAIVKFEPYL